MRLRQAPSILLSTGVASLALAACAETELAPSQRVHWADGGFAWRIDCGGGDCDAEAKRICPHGHELLRVDQSNILVVGGSRWSKGDGDNNVREALVVRCTSEWRKWDNAPLAARRSGPRVDVCNAAFTHLHDLANAWVEANPGRAIQTDLPTRDRFVAACARRSPTTSRFA